MKFYKSRYKGIHFDATLRGIPKIEKVWALIDRKNLDIYISQAHIGLGTCLTILGISKSYALWKNCIFKFKTDLKSVNEKHTLNSDVPKPNPCGVENKVTEVS